MELIRNYSVKVTRTTLIQQIVEDSVKNISETETNSEERVKITIKIEKY